MPPKSGKKGLSLEEKRVKLLEFFTRDHMFYNIKEVESQGSKSTGVHPMQIKDLLQTLLDDNLVNAEKCGVTTLYWCFEYDKHKKMEGLINSNKEKLDSLKQKKERLINSLDQAKSARNRGDGLKIVSNIEELSKKRDKLNLILESSVYDFDRVESIKKDLNARVLKGQISSDNIEMLVYHFNKNSGINRDYFHQELGIPEEFEEFPELDLAFSKLS